MSDAVPTQTQGNSQASEPTRLRVLKRLTEEVERRAGLPGAVFRGRDYFGPENGDPVPMITIFEDMVGADDYSDQTDDGALSVVVLRLLIVGFDNEDMLNPTDPATVLMYRVIGALRDIKRDGAKRGAQYLGLDEVDGIQIGNGTVSPAYADGNSPVAFFRLPLTIRYVED